MPFFDALVLYYCFYIRPGSRRTTSASGKIHNEAQGIARRYETDDLPPVVGNYLGRYVSLFSRDVFIMLLKSIAFFVLKTTWFD